MAIELVVAPDPEEAARRAAELLVELARAGGHVALSGGSTPRRAYELAAELEPDWSRVDVWLGDERCVPADDPLANMRLVQDDLVKGAEQAGKGSPGLTPEQVRSA